MYSKSKLLEQARTLSKQIQKALIQYYAAWDWEPPKSQHKAEESKVDFKQQFVFVLCV